MSATGTTASFKSLTTTGNVGIGTAATYPLTVAGDVSCTGKFLGNGLTVSDLTSTSNLFTSNATVYGTLSAANINVSGTVTTVNTADTVSTSLTINNLGTGPALKVTQSETGALGAQPVAQFFNGAGTAALIIDNNGNVGVNKSSAATELDISGTVTASHFAGDDVNVSGSVNASGLIGCISNSVSTTSSTIAASSTAVKAANDLAALALPKSGGQ